MAISSSTLSPEVLQYVTRAAAWWYDLRKENFSHLRPTENRKHISLPLNFTYDEVNQHIMNTVELEVPHRNQQFLTADIWTEALLKCCCCYVKGIKTFVSKELLLSNFYHDKFWEDKGKLVDHIGPWIKRWALAARITRIAGLKPVRGISLSVSLS